MRGGSLEESLASGNVGAIDEAIRTTFTRLERAAPDLARGAENALDALDDVRPITGKNAFDRLTELYAHDPLAKEGARRHVAALCMQRIAKDPILAHGRALTEPHIFARQDKNTSSFTSSIAALVTEPDAKMRRANLALLERNASDVAAEAREASALRAEVCVRLGIAPPIAYAAEVSASALEAGARALIASTQSVFEDVLSRQRKRTERRDLDLFDGIDLARIDRATDGWPAKISREWLKEALPAVSAFPADIPKNTSLVGASSFLRVLAAYGNDLRSRTAPRSLPFVVAHDPWPRAQARVGFLFASLGTAPAFHKRALGLSPGRAKDQSLWVTEGAVVFARFLAMRLLFALSAPSASDFEELTSLAFGAPAPSALRNAWPVLTLSEGTRFVALLEACAWSSEMQDRYDEDWFQNPRAGKHLAARFVGPMRDVDAPTDLVPLANALARAVEGAFG